MQDVVHVFVQIRLPAELLDEFFHHLLRDPPPRRRRYFATLHWWLHLYWVDELGLDEQLRLYGVTLGIHGTFNLLAGRRL